MAIRFVNNVDFGFYNTKGFALENSDPAPSTTVEGAMYYNTNTDILYYRDASSWVPLTENTEGVSTFTNANGTFISAGTVNTAATGAVTMGIIDLSAVDGTATIASRFLTKDNTWSTAGYYISWLLGGDDGVSQTIINGETVDFAGGTGINTVVTTIGSGSKLTINNTGVTSIIAGTNISVDQATAQVTITSTDEFVGTVTSVSAGAGLFISAGISTVNPTIAVDYTSTDNIILAAADGTSATLAGTDKILVSTGDAKYTNLSQITTFIGAVTSVTGTAPVVSSEGLTPAISVTTATPESGNANLSTSGQIYTWVTGLGYEDGTVTSVTVTGGTGLTGSGTVTATGTITLNVDYQGVDNYILATTDGTATAASGDTVNFSDVTDNNVKETTFGQVPIAALTLVKEYIDSTAGALIYQGAYDAATNTPDLDSSPSALIQLGWTYTVSVAGDFFTEAVQVGDLLIAEVDSPTTLAQWTVIQGNTDLATASAVGIGNVVPGSSSTITAPYTTGTATLDVVDSAAAQKGAVIIAGGDGITVTYSSGTATVAQDTGSGKSKKVVLDSGDTGVAVATVGDDKIWTLTVDNAAIFGSGALGANIMAECYLISNGTTAYPEVVRDTSNTNELEFKFNMPVPPSDGDYVVLLHNVAGI